MRDFADDSSVAVDHPVGDALTADAGTVLNTKPVRLEGLVFPRCRSMLSVYTSTTSFVSVITTHKSSVPHGDRPVHPFNRKHDS